MRLYGNFFYNRRSDTLNEEERLYKFLDLEDKIIIEAGAHIGIYTMFFAMKANKGKVLAFEPNPINFNLLKKNIKANRIKNVTIQNTGLSNERKKLYFCSKRHNTSKGTFKKEKQQIMKEENVPLIFKEILVTTIDDIVDTYSLQNVDFIKIDTEGFEPPVIEGSATIIKKFKPLIYFEIHGLTSQQKKNDFKKIFKFLKKYDYRIANLAKSFPDVSEEVINDCFGGGYIAFQDKLDLYLQNTLRP
jgi:FkbM family methyltransferase